MNEKDRNDLWKLNKKPKGVPEWFFNYILM